MHDDGNVVVMVCSPCHPWCVTRCPSSYLHCLWVRWQSFLQSRSPLCIAGKLVYSKGRTQSHRMAGSSGSRSSAWNPHTDLPSVPPRKHTGHRDWMEQLSSRLNASVESGLAVKNAYEQARSKSGMPEPPPSLDWRTVEGVRAIGFNPGRRAWYIMGRPVAATCPQSEFHLRSMTELRAFRLSEHMC